MSALTFLSSCSSPGYCIANGRVEEVNRKLLSATEPAACLDSLLPLPAAFPYHTAVMHADFDDAEEMAVGARYQGKQIR